MVRKQKTKQSRLRQSRLRQSRAQRSRAQRSRAQRSRAQPPRSLIWFSLIAIILVNLAGIQQVSHAQSPVCRGAVNQGQQRIAQVVNTEIVSVNRFRHAYPDGPSQRPFAYQFLMSGLGTETVMNSPVLLQSISDQIMSSCDDVGLVHFGIDQTDWGVRFGLVTRVSQFRCLDPEVGRDPRWGSMVCP